MTPITPHGKLAQVLKSGEWLTRYEVMERTGLTDAVVNAYLSRERIEKKGSKPQRYRVRG